LRAFSRHAFVDDVLAQPGDCDITASINWSQVQAAGARLGFTTVEFAPTRSIPHARRLLDDCSAR
jgi:SAM-dependent MidA family methyltransferase